MPAQQRGWTAEMARARPEDGKRYEVLDGALFVSPAPSLRHQRAVQLLYEIIAPYVRSHAVGEAFLSPADVEFSPRDLVQPDLFVVPRASSGRLHSWSEITSLLLAVEVVSPSTARSDRHDKRLAYRRARVPLYWIVDLEGRVVECWRPDDDRPEILGEVIVWGAGPSVPPLEIDLQSFFAEVLDP